MISHNKLEHNLTNLIHALKKEGQRHSQDIIKAEAIARELGVSINWNTCKLETK